MGLLESFGFPDKSHFRIEGRHSLEAALKAGWIVDAIFHTSQAESTWPTEILRPSTREELSAKLGFQFHRGVVALARRPSELPLPSPLPKLLLGLSGIADPGNLGTLIRNAAAFGVGAVLCDASCTDPFNPKAVRSSATAIFQVPVISNFDFVSSPALKNLHWIATSSHAASLPLNQYRPSPDTPTLLLLGNEGEGLPDSLLQKADLTLSIEQSSKLESLNVASASAILLHHLWMQRS